MHAGDRGEIFFGFWREEKALRREEVGRKAKKSGGLGGVAGGEG